MLRILKPPFTDLNELREIQKEVADRAIKRDELGDLDTVAGCDVSFSEDGVAYASCVSFEYPELNERESRVVKVGVDFPYIPTFLAFRELEPLLKAVKEVAAGVYMVDGQGLAHPRRAGLASHLGVVIDRPTIGVAKSRLCGEAPNPAKEKGSYSLLKEDGEVIGAILRTRTGVKPVYVSIGHKVSLERAIEITLKSSPKYKIPEPIRVAHRLSTGSMKNEG